MCQPNKKITLPTISLTLTGILIFSSPGYSFPPPVVTTLQETIAFPSVSGLSKNELSKISQYDKYGYGKWTRGPALPSQTRSDIMPADYNAASVTKKTKLLNFFAMTDIHITDKESPSQLIYLQQAFYQVSPIPGFGNYPWAFETSVYSPVMLYTTHVLDAAIQTVNAIHKQTPIDFGISLGDTINSTQYNELRWYIDVLDGKIITPSSGAHLGANTIDYQKPFKAAGLDKSIPWYQTLGNHDHFWLGSLVVDDFLRRSYVSDTILAMGDILQDALIHTNNYKNPDYYMGVLDGSTPYGEIRGAGPSATFNTPPKVPADPNRRSLLQTEWMSEFFKTSSKPVGHGFKKTDAQRGFASYSFIPKSNIPIKVIVLDDTQKSNDGDTSIHGHGFLDQERYTWLKKELAAGDSAGQLMIIAAHIPIGVQPNGSFMEWWSDPQNAVTLPDLIAELQSHPNLLMWIAGHRHFNTVKAFASTDPAHPENGFWQVETSSLRDFPQQFRTFEIYLNSDYTISIATTDVDPAVKEGTPAAQSRKYAIATQQIVGNYLNPNNKNSDPNLPPNTEDPTIMPMGPSFSYNATLFKKLSPQMVKKMKALYPKNMQ